MIFKFKEFNIIQQNTAMKVGTDGVLLGAWTSIKNNPNSILDIGTGTGLIALQLAQRSNAEIIDALEINDVAFQEAVTNFENSNWADRLFCYHTSLKEFTAEINDKYDLIVSNPPFYSNVNYANDNRKNARSTSSLTFNELLKSVSYLLNKNGIFSVIIPYSEEQNFIKIAKSFFLYTNDITYVKGNQKTKIKRSLITFSFNKKPIKNSILIIENERHVYTKTYQNLVKDFYLKM